LNSPGFQPICNLTQSPQLVVVNSGSRYQFDDYGRIIREANIRAE
jgi:hypothetical protein